jgi:hypothetical protein
MMIQKLILVFILMISFSLNLNAFNQDELIDDELICQDNFDLIQYYLYFQYENLSDEELNSIDDLCLWIDKACLNITDQKKLEYLQAEKICKTYQG